MKKGTRKETTGSSLRHRAEERLGKAEATKEGRPSQADALKLIHELKVHQIELEMQNEELMAARAESESSLEKYSDLYDFAPVGYFTLTDDGIIQEANTTGATLLGKERSRLINRRFSQFLSPETHPTFLAFLKKIFKGHIKETCEVLLSSDKNNLRYIQLEGTSVEAGGSVSRQCRMVALDITEHKLAEEALQMAKEELEKRVLERTCTLRDINERLQLELSERKKAEDALREITEELDHFFNISLDLLSIADTDGYFRSLNLAWERTLGYTCGELAARPFIDFVHPDDVEKTREAIAVLTSQREVINFQNRYRCKDGSYRWIEWAAAPSGKMIFSSARDITERKQTEKRLSKNSERSSLLLELYLNAPQMSDKELYDYVLEKAVNLTDSSIGFFHLVSDDQKSSILTTWCSDSLVSYTAAYNNHYPIDQAGNWADCVRLKKTIVNNNYQNPPDRKGYPEGQSPVVRLMSIPVIEQDKVKIIFGVGNKAEDYDKHDVIDLQLLANETFKIIKQRRSDDALSESEESYHMLFNSITDAIFVHEISSEGVPGIFLEVNNVACRLLGYSREELLRMSPDDISAPASETGVKPLPVIQDLINGRNVVFEEVHVARDGRLIPVEISCCKGSLQGRSVVIALVRDISERKQAEEEQHKLRQSLAHASRLNMMGELATSLAHEINQPLAAILANAQAARNIVDGSDPDMQELHEALDDIIDDDKRAGEVIKRVRAQIRKEDSKQEQVDINKVIQEAVELIERELVLKGILVRMDLVHGLPSLKGDRIQIGQVVINLVMNAIEAMGNDPEVPQVITLHSRMDGEKNVAVSVEDTGKGIDEKNLRLLFDPFYTSKAQGMGLGLSISRSIIEAHGGKLLVIQNPGGGATFSFSLRAH